MRPLRLRLLIKLMHEVWRRPFRAAHHAHAGAYAAEDQPHDGKEGREDSCEREPRSTGQPRGEEEEDDEQRRARARLRAHIRRVVLVMRLAVILSCVRRPLRVLVAADPLQPHQKPHERPDKGQPYGREDRPPAGGGVEGDVVVLEHDEDNLRESEAARHDLVEGELEAGLVDEAPAASRGLLEGALGRCPGKLQDPDPLYDEQGDAHRAEAGLEIPIQLGGEQAQKREHAACINERLEPLPRCRALVCLRRAAEGTAHGHGAEHDERRQDRRPTPVHRAVHLQAQEYGEEQEEHEDEPEGDDDTQPHPPSAVRERGCNLRHIEVVEGLPELQALLPMLVVECALFRIAQHLIRLLCTPELLCSALVPLVLVRVQLQGRLFPCLLELLRSRIPRHPQEFVEVCVVGCDSSWCIHRASAGGHGPAWTWDVLSLLQG
mmetsp:Transcript_39204/g.96501  ORF Transcript_39204/g.96501 Transcript_39204/m.96501 type:complete len:435 (-) Transcript_39204:77-1381(-)